MTRKLTDEQGDGSANWPCGHERTPQNTQSVGKAGVRCRICRCRTTRKHFRKKFGVPLERQMVWPFDDAPTQSGVTAR